MRPTDVPDTGEWLVTNESANCLVNACDFSGLLCDLLWSDPDKDVQGWGENDRGVSFTFGPGRGVLLCWLTPYSSYPNLFQMWWRSSSTATI